METEIIDGDIILCNHCGSEAVEFMPPQEEPPKPVIVDREAANKQMVDESIDYLLSFLPFGIGKKKPTLHRRELSRG
jgi:single-stranded DNA-specific DHH superfamily exonuclease